MPTGKARDLTTAKFGDLSAKDQAFVEQRFHAIAEINRLRASAVEAHLEMVRRGLIDFRSIADSW